MAREAIIEKLSNTLATDISSEQQVVYILVEIRKYLEREKLKDEYKALNFFCSWAVHARLHGEGGQRILRRFDKLHGQLLTHDMDIEKLTQEARNEIGETMNLSRFKNELLAFLSRPEVGLATEWVTDKVRWLLFVNLYSLVIEDCPLVLSEDKNAVPLKYVKDLTVRIVREPKEIYVPHDNQVLMFVTSWTMTFKDKDDMGEISMYFTIPEEDLSGR